MTTVVLILLHLNTIDKTWILFTIEILFKMSTHVLCYHNKMHVYVK